MRGSPLLRTLIILTLLFGSGLGLLKLTASEPVTPVSRKISEAGGKDDRDAIIARYFLTFSEPPIEAVLEGNGSSELDLGVDTVDFTGELTIDRTSPVVFLTAKWVGENVGHRFAKLVIEAPGEMTFTHVFDASGNIDDFVELPF
ncbi:hypothetical protein ACFSSA_07350 [Luteolibacter algae]|uniref:Uncharacterized protein n=1 Tax=Luteolibacter algae TaxID=454151 RepID=A0ABW5D7C6_9BACT